MIKEFITGFRLGSIGSSSLTLTKIISLALTKIISDICFNINSKCFNNIDADETLKTDDINKLSEFFRIDSFNNNEKNCKDENSHLLH